MSLNNLQCSNCAATEVQRLSMVYHSGTSNITTTTRGNTSGVGIGAGGLGFGTASSRHTTSGTQMTELAQRAAPPERALAFRWILIGAGVAIVLLILHAQSLALLALAIAGLLAWRGFHHNAKVYPGLRQQWEQSWLCHRCGTIFAF